MTWGTKKIYHLEHKQFCRSDKKVQSQVLNNIQERSFSDLCLQSFAIKTDYFFVNNISRDHSRTAIVVNKGVLYAWEPIYVKQIIFSRAITDRKYLEEGQYC